MLWDGVEWEAGRENGRNDGGDCRQRDLQLPQASAGEPGTSSQSEPALPRYKKWPRMSFRLFQPWRRTAVVVRRPSGTIHRHPSSLGLSRHSAPPHRRPVDIASGGASSVRFEGCEGQRGLAPPSSSGRARPRPRPRVSEGPRG